MTVAVMTEFMESTTLTYNISAVYPVLLSSIEWFGVENYIGIVARFGTGNIALSTQLNPWNSEDWPIGAQWDGWEALPTSALEI